MNKDLLRSKKTLDKRDTELETYGCRHTNPDICNSNCLEGICAFTRNDCICKKPPRSWKRIFKEMKYNN